MKYNILLILSFLPFLTSAQFKTSVDLIGSLDYSYRDINEKNTIEEYRKFIDAKGLETALIRTRFGFNVNQRISKKLILKSGLRIVNIGYRSPDNINLKFISQINPFGGFEDIPSGESLKGFSTAFNHFFIEVPLIVRYESSYNFGAFTPYFETGISGLWYILSFYNVETFGEKEFQKEKKSNMNTLQLAGSFGIGVNYAANERTQLFLQPTYRYHFTPMTKSKIVEHTYSIGLELGCRLKLK